MSAIYSATPSADNMQKWQNLYLIIKDSNTLFRCYDKLKKHIEDYPEVEERLCINGPYDTGMWRLSVRPERPAGVSEDIMSAFVTVSLFPLS